MHKSFRDRLWLGTSAGLLTALLLQPAYASAATGSSSGTGTSAGSSSQPTVAPALTAAQVAAAAAKTLGIPSTYTQQGVNYQSSWNGGQIPVYTMNWQGGPMMGPGGQNISVTVNADTGQILQVFNFSSQTGWNLNPGVTQAQAAAAAQTWLQKLAPAQAGELSLQPNPSGPQYKPPVGQYSFVFARKVNGVVVAFDNAQIGIGQDGRLTSYTFNWQHAAFPTPPANIMPVAQINQTYGAALGLHLSYAYIYSPFSQKPQMVVTYLPSQNNFSMYSPLSGQQAMSPWFDPVTGALLQTNGQAAQASNAPSLTPLVTGGPDTLPAPLAKPLSESQAQKAASALLPASGNFTLVNSNYQSYTNPGQATQMTWNFNYADQNSSTGLNITIDAATGLIENMNEYQMGPGSPSSGSSSQTALTSAQAEAAAASFVEKALPTMTGGVTYDGPSPFYGSGTNNIAQESFSMLVNGIATENQISVGVNLSTGQVVDYSAFLNSGVTYPAVGAVVPVSTAEAASIAKDPLQLMYVMPYQLASSKVTGYGPQTIGSTAMLVYAPQQNSSPDIYNANTGQWQTQGYPPTAGVQEPSDIKGHYGAQDMNLLVNRGLLKVQNGKVHPNSAMTRGQFIRLLVEADGAFYSGGTPSSAAFADVPQTSKYYSFVQQAVTQGWLKPGGNFSPDSPITRERAADWIVSFMGWHELAKQTGLFSVNFADASAIPAQFRGDAAIVAKLGIIPSVSGKFLPTQPLTVADAAVAVVTTMQLYSQEQQHP